MAITILKTIPKAGRTYGVTVDGATDIIERYQLVLSAPMGIDDLPTSFSGIPAIGTVHPNRSGYYVSHYKVSQPDGSEKNTLIIEVAYEPISFSVGEGGAIIEAITEWGWDDGTAEAELIADATDATKIVVNSAGDPFESAPSHTIPAPVFTKVLRTKSRKSGYSNLMCKINSKEVSIGDMTCPPHTLLCTIGEKRIIGGGNLKYEYTIHLRYRSQRATIEQKNKPEEVGWGIPIVDAGMREFKDGVLQLMTVPDTDNNQPATVTSPELLNGHGQRIARPQTDSPVTPYVMLFQGYQEADFPAWLTSEPT